ncbi:MAG: YidC/Oxa1 family insertase periplasmic-domain containing protein, partial [Victivallales bacterium]|nr:YidC/Oxa1 family insertase periplasmic-domain containing protein [Victivallales bacterium]
MSRSQEETVEIAPETSLVLFNDKVELTISSHGGAIFSAMLTEYPAENSKESTPVILDFETAPALRYDGIPLTDGLLEETNEGLRYTTELEEGRFFERLFALDEDYVLTIEDSFVNSGEIPWALPALRLPTGPMANPEGTSAMKGMTTLGIDTFSPVDGVNHWGKKLRKLNAGVRQFTSTSDLIPAQPVEWIAAKNKFFVQILTPEEGTSSFDLSVLREGEGKKMTAVEVSA